MRTNTVEPIDAAAEYIQARCGQLSPTIGLVLGSGLGVLVENIEDKVIIDYKDIPGFPVSTVEGHAGKLIIGRLRGKTVMAMQGRFHYYEGQAFPQLALPVRVMHRLGVHTLIVTAASGGINRALKAGDIMLITDHINISFSNPLIGPNNDALGPRFPDTSHVYTTRLQQVARNVANENNIRLAEGTYLFTSGPTFETPAEVRMMDFMGADVCGMSTFPEALAAAHCGMEVLGLTYVANMAAGISGEPLSHHDVLNTMAIVKDDFLKLLDGVVDQM
jgi:purine-nucleoside phosphorylase